MATGGDGACPVCTDAFTSSVRKPVRCPACLGDACLRCCKSYVALKEQPCCPLCNAAWAKDFSDAVFPRTFRMTELRAKRENVLLELEKTLLAHTQSHARLEMERRTLSQTIRRETDDIYRLERKLQQRRDQLALRSTVSLFASNVVQSDVPMPLAFQQGDFSGLHAVDRHVLRGLGVNVRLRNLLDGEENPPRVAAAEGNAEGGDDNAEVSSQQRQFMRRCPATACMGFLTSAWKCGMCGLRVCNKCGESMGFAPPSASAEEKKKGRKQEVLQGLGMIVAHRDSNEAHEPESNVSESNVSKSNVAESHVSESNVAESHEPEANEPESNVARTSSSNDNEATTSSYNPNDPNDSDDSGDPNNPNEHVCKADNVASMQLLARDTRPCPSCSVPIHKLSGCDQMWCPECKTAFSWRTGRIETRVIHNPHYFEYMHRVRQGQGPENNNNGPVNNGCGGHRNNPAYHFEYIPRTVRTKIVMAAFRCMQHVRCVTLSRFADVAAQRARSFELRNRDLRIRFLLKEISEADMKRTLQARERKLDVHSDLRDVMDTFVQAGGDVVRQLSTSAINAAEAERQLLELRTYCNDTFQTVATRQACKVYNISDAWVINDGRMTS